MPIEITVLTPEVTRKMNEEVERGERLPYTFFAMSDQDYLSFGQWLQDVLRYVKQLNNIVEYYQNDRTKGRPQEE